MIKILIGIGIGAITALIVLLFCVWWAIDGKYWFRQWWSEWFD